MSHYHIIEDRGVSYMVQLTVPHSPGSGVILSASYTGGNVMHTLSREAAIRLAATLAAVIALAPSDTIALQDPAFGERVAA